LIMDYLTISKRFELSLSYRYRNGKLSEAVNRELFGDKAGTPHGYGGNWTAFFVFDGPVDDKTGMMVNIATVKQRIGDMLAQRYDHKFLNQDTSPFDKIVPTPENAVRQMLLDAAGLFDDIPDRRLAACHLVCSPFDGATAYADGRVERHYWLEFSAARRTYSPHLTDEENRQLFGMASAVSGHGHYYRLRVTLHGDIDDDSGMIYPEREAESYLEELKDLIDHKNLNTDVRELAEKPMTTECLARYFYERLNRNMPVGRVRLWENPYFFAEYHSENYYMLGLKDSFQAAHRLHCTSMNEGQNTETFGKCNNLAGHGHNYVIEATLNGEFDEKTGILFPLFDFQDALKVAIKDWHYKHLDRDTPDFSDCVSTGENIVRKLCPKIEQRLGRDLSRLRLWETPNNRFTLRKDYPKVK